MAHRSASHVVVFAASAAILAGCNHELPPATTLAASLQGPGNGDSSVVFVRPVSPCDTSGYSIVVDERGHFVGNVSPGMQVSVAVSPGPHVFYSWSSLDLRIESQPSFNTVAAARVEAAPGQTEYLALIVNRPTYNCLDWAIVDLRVIGQSDGYWNELQEVLHATQPVNADTTAGQAILDGKPALLKLYLELGHRKMQQLDETRIRDAERRAVRAETR